MTFPGIKNKWDNLFGRKLTIENFPLADCVHYCAFRYGRRDFNPYENYVQGIHKGESIEFIKNNFIEFLKYYRPRTLGETLGIKLNKNYPMWVYPWSNPRWLKQNQTGSTAGWYERIDQVPDIVTHFCEDGILYERIQEEFFWLHRAYELISTHGYRPGEHQYVSAQILIKSDGERRALILDGNHRISAMSALGYTSFDLQYHPGTVIRETEMRYWPGIRSGLFSESDAHQIFDAYFSGNHAYHLAEVPARIIGKS